jgi:hypothetical protein
MKVDITPQLGDNIPGLLYEAHEVGNVIKATSGHPCSDCNGQPHDHKRTNHFHMSSDFGGCGRKTFNIMTTGKRNGLSGFNFLNDGHIHEAAILNNINRGLPEGYQVKIAENGIEGRYNHPSGFYITAHVDALLITPYGVEGLECKAVKQAMWKKISETGEINDEWYGQVQGYMVVWELERWYLCVKHRETSKFMIPFRIDRDVPYIVSRMAKLEDIYKRIMTGDRQPERDHTSSKDYECLWCPFGNEVGDGSCWREDIKFQL